MLCLYLVLLVDDKISGRLPGQTRAAAAAVTYTNLTADDYVLTSDRLSLIIGEHNLSSPTSEPADVGAGR